MLRAYRREDCRLVPTELDLMSHSPPADAAGALWLYLITRNRAARDHDAEEIEHAGPDHRDRRGQRVGVDHRGDGVGGVVEAVDELEAERDQKGDEQKRYGR